MAILKRVKSKLKLISKLIKRNVDAIAIPTATKVLKFIMAIYCMIWLG